MAINTTTINGDVFLPSGAVREKSFVIFEMTGFDTDADDDAVVVNFPIRAQIAADGSINQDLWPNPAGVRSTFYKVTIEVHNGISPHNVCAGSIVVPSTGGSYALNDLLPVSPPSGVGVEEYIAYLEASVASAEDAADRAEAAAELVGGVSYGTRFTITITEDNGGRGPYPLPNGVSNPEQLTVHLNKLTLQPIQDYTVVENGGSYEILFNQDVFVGSDVWGQAAATVPYDPNLQNVSDFETAADYNSRGVTLPDGRTVVIGGVLYTYKAGATDIPNLAGLEYSNVIPADQDFTEDEGGVFDTGSQLNPFLTLADMIAAAPTGPDGKTFYVRDLAYVVESGAAYDGLPANIAPAGDVTPEHLGASFGIDASGAVSTALMVAAARGQKFSANGHYLMNSPVDIDISGMTLTLNCANATWDFSSAPANVTSVSDGNLFGISGSVGSGVLLSSSSAAFSEEVDSANYGLVSVADGSTFSQGLFVFLQSDEVMFSGRSTKLGEMSKVCSVSVNDVYLKDNITFGYTTAESASLSVVSPATVRGDIGTVIGGGVGSGHTGVGVLYGADIDLTARTLDCENVGVKFEYCYSVTGKFWPENCTSPTPLGNTGYGVLLGAGTRHADVVVYPVNCRHSLAGGGLHPAIFAKVRGHAVDCGIGVPAWDAHEDCRYWNFDVSAEGGFGGLTFRGSHADIRYSGVNCRVGLKITNNSDVFNQDGIYIDHVNVDGCDGPALQLGSVTDQRMARAHVGTVIAKDCRGAAVSVSNCDEFLFDSITIQGSRLLSGDSATADHLFLSDVGKVEGGLFKSSDALAKGIEATDVDVLSISNASISGSGSHCVDCTDVGRFSVGGGILTRSGSFHAPINLLRVTMADTRCDLIGDILQPTQDCIRCVDVGTLRVSSAELVSGRYGANLTGTGGVVLAVGNDARGVVSSTKFNSVGAVTLAGNLS